MQRKKAVFRRSEEDVEAKMKEIKDEPVKIAPKKDKYLEIKKPMWRYKKLPDPQFFL